LLKLMTEPRQYRPEGPVVPAVQPLIKEAAKPVSAADRKLLDDYAKAVQRCRSGRIVLDKVSGFYVPELNDTCMTKDEAKLPPRSKKEYPAFPPRLPIHTEFHRGFSVSGVGGRTHPCAEAARSSTVALRAMDLRSIARRPGAP